MVHTIVHLFPSRANFAGLLVESDCGFAALVGLLPTEGEVLLGTVEEAHRAGFLCVISLFSTLRRPFVTSAPRLSSANTAATPPPEPGVDAGGWPGAGGGRGGGAPPVASVADFYSLRGIPLREANRYGDHFREERPTTFGFQLSPVAWYSMLYFLDSSNKLMNARTHSTCFGSLEEVFMSNRKRAASLDTLVFIFLDQSIAIEFRLLLDILHKWTRFSLLTEA